MEALALIIAAGLLAREILNMRASNRALLDGLTSTRSHAARLIRRVRQQRDSYGAALDELWDEHQELRVEADAYRREESARSKEGRSAWN